MVTLDVALDLLVAENRLERREKNSVCPRTTIHISGEGQESFGPCYGDPGPTIRHALGLYQAAKDIGVDVSSLEKALKIGVKLGDVVMIE